MVVWLFFGSVTFLLWLLSRFHFLLRTSTQAGVDFGSCSSTATLWATVLAGVGNDSVWLRAWRSLHCKSLAGCFPYFGLCLLSLATLMAVASKSNGVLL